MLSASMNHMYCGFLSRYSFVLSAWVTPSSESTTGHAKSYVGYEKYLDLITTNAKDMRIRRSMVSRLLLVRSRGDPIGLTQFDGGAR